ncbi:hypothetical protein T459_04634 [Capsicum annuum]|uniref:Uncharacterized protein n=1 Tax=Capsicum annuum TaxID=4072 RepID=A0A2G3A5P2_CAPAN|nr:hypothetical protein T459_04634 [Capsicum annuum]
MAVHSLENLSPNCPLGQSSKIKRREGDAENDVSHDMHIKRMEIEKLLEERVSSPSCTREGQSEFFICTVISLRRAVFDKEKAVAYLRIHSLYIFCPHRISPGRICGGLRSVLSAWGWLLEVDSGDYDAVTGGVASPVAGSGGEVDGHGWCSDGAGKVRATKEALMEKRDDRRWKRKC